jgi:hypothetical protein
MTESAKMSALRQQRWRARQRDGKIVVAIEVDEKVTAWLINANLLAEEEGYDRQKVAVALARAINLSIL